MPYMKASEIPEAEELADPAAAILACRRIEATFFTGMAMPELVALREPAKACLTGIARRYADSKEVALALMHSADDIDLQFKTCMVEPVVPFLRATDRKVREHAYAHFEMCGGIETARLLFDVAVEQYEQGGGEKGIDRLLPRSIRSYGPAGRAAVTAYEAKTPAQQQVKSLLLAKEQWELNPLRAP
jgi:hypothetical protein